jgi:hypothetical protein
MNLVLRIAKLEQLFEGVDSFGTVFFLYGLINATGKSEQPGRVGFGQFGYKSSELLLSLGDGAIEPDLFITINNQQVKVLPQVSPQHLLITKVINPTTINTVLKRAV